MESEKSNQFNYQIYASFTVCCDPDAYKQFIEWRTSKSIDVKVENICILEDGRQLTQFSVVITGWQTYAVSIITQWLTDHKFELVERNKISREILRELANEEPIHAE